MPSCVIHIYTAYRLRTALGTENIPDLLLGSVAPDGVNTSGQAPREIRYAAHQRVSDPDSWKRRISEFCRLERDKFSFCRDYFNGYVIHLLTDIVWDELVQPPMFEKLSEYVSADELRTEKWSEIHKYCRTLMASPHWEKLKGLLAQGQARSITTVTKEMVESLRRRILSETYPEVAGQPPVFLNDSHLHATIAGVKQLWETLI